MDHETLESLDFWKVKTKIASLCFSKEGQNFLLETPIFQEEEDWRKSKENIEKILMDLERNNPLPEVSFPPIKDILDFLKQEGQYLEGNELRDLSLYFQSLPKVGDYLIKIGLEDLANQIPPLNDLTPTIKEILRLIDSNGELLEDKIPALQKIKKTMGQTYQEISSIARTHLNNAQQGLWENNVPTQKDGRILLALKSSYKGKVDGIVHESSASGATLYLEPLDMLEKNNQLSSLQHEYRIQILQLFKSWTSAFIKKKEELKMALEIFCEIDGFLARARYGHRTKGSFVGVNQKPISLINARHPLLGLEAVPISFTMAENIQALVGSGPNTGGKTVSLKTLGLFCLLHQFAVPIAAEPVSNLPFFSQVFTDIGDRQTLEGSLSTFSGHMARIHEILKKVDNNSLVILDELGTGTDPREGEALAVALLEEFLKSKSTLFLTTHFSQVKNYAYIHPNIQNACMSYNEASQKPTYQIIPDLPGESHALDMAMKSGLSQHIIARAKNLLEETQGEQGELLAGLIKKHKELDEQKANIDRWTSNLEKQSEVLEKDKAQFFEKEQELRKEGLKDLRDFLNNSRTQLENLVRLLREQGVEKTLTKEVKQFTQSVAAIYERENTKLQEWEDKRPTENVNWTKGMEVWILPGNKRGKVHKIFSPQKIQVSVGSIKMIVKPQDLRPVQKPSVETQGAIETILIPKGAASFVLDLRGHRLETALNLLEKQIDQGILENLLQFSVIHGLGEGILKEGVTNYLRQRKEVKNFFHPRPEEGGFGKTIVILG